MNAPRPLRRAFVLVVTASLTTTMAGIAPAGVSGQGERSFNASISDDRVSGWGFRCPVTVTLTKSAATGTYTVGGDACTADGFDLFLDPSEQANPWDVLPGQTITVTDNNASPKILVVADLAIVGYDLAANEIWGTSDSNATVSANAWRPDGSYASVGGSLGNEATSPWTWTAGFDGAEPTYQLRVMDQAAAQQCDGDGDCTETSLAALAPPRFGFGLETMEVIGYDWPAGATVTLTIDRPTTTKNPDFTGTTTAAAETITDTFLPTGNGNVYFQLAAGSLHPVPGDVMTMSATTAQGTTTKTQVIPNLTVNLPDVDAGTVSGTTAMPATSFLTVGLEGWWRYDSMREVTPSGGAWTTSFAGEFDIIQPWAYVTDVDGDSTASLAPAPGMDVDPAADRVWAADFASGNVTLTVARGGSTMSTTTVATGNIFTGGCMRLDMWAQPTGNLPRPTMALFDLKGVFDIQGGDVLTATDRVGTQRTITVDHLTVDVVNQATDTLSGNADAPVTPHMGMGCSGYWGYGSATPVGGLWNFVFDPNAFPFVGIDLGTTGYVLGQSGTTMVAWKAPCASFSGFFQPVDNRPTVNTVKAGRAIPVTFSLGADYGLGIFAPGYPLSQLTPSRPGLADPIEVTVTAGSSGLTYHANTGRYTYLWKTDKAWAGTDRVLILRFRDGNEQRAYFRF